MENEKKPTKTKWLSKKQMLVFLTLLSILLGLLIRIPMFSVAPFLVYDPKDVPILLCTFVYGPLYGMAMAAISAIVQGLSVSASGGLTGILMNVAASWVCLWVAGNAYKINRNLIFALFCAAAVQTLALTVANMLFTPMFLGVSVQEVLALIGPAVIPFNLVKCGLNGVFVYLCYKLFPHLFEMQ